jgi:nucleoside phosphorylase
MATKIISDLRKLRLDHDKLSDSEVLEAAQLLDRLSESTLSRFTTGIVTALPIEMAALESCFSEVRDIEMRGMRYKVAAAPVRGSNSKRVLSIIKRAADMGNNSAAICATNMLTAFPNLEDVIMVGIAGGIPYPDNAEKHVRLGDLVISDHQGVTQYDFGKQYKDYFEEKQRGRPPSAKLIDAINELATQELKGNRIWEEYIDDLSSKLNWVRPSESTDKLYIDDASDDVVSHPVDNRRQEGRPRVFRGKIGSANLVLKSSSHRKKIREKHEVLAVEMEASGIADATWHHSAGYLVIRGICDYADRRKNDEWHKYAALIAAAYCKAVLEV